MECDCELQAEIVDEHSEVGRRDNMLVRSELFAKELTVLVEHTMNLFLSVDLCLKSLNQLTVSCIDAIALIGAEAILSAAPCCVCANAIHMGIASLLSRNEFTNRGKLFFVLFALSNGASFALPPGSPSAGLVIVMIVEWKASRTISRPVPKASSWSSEMASLSTCVTPDIILISFSRILRSADSLRMSRLMMNCRIGSRSMFAYRRLKSPTKVARPARISKSTPQPDKTYLRAIAPRLFQWD